VVGTSIIPTFRRLRQENCKFKTGLGYKARPCLKIPGKKSKKEKSSRSYYIDNFYILMYI
jgi:hypothetical protein